MTLVKDLKLEYYNIKNRKLITYETINQLNYSTHKKENNK